jgi:uncharacterized protein DUF4136
MSERGRKMNLTIGKRPVQHAAGTCIVLLSYLSIALAQDVRYNSMPGTDFSKYHTYKWAEVPNGKHPSQILDQEIKQDIDNTLSTKGFTQATIGNPDLFVVYQIAVDQEKQWNAMGMGRGFGGGMGQATSSTINNGTLVVDFYDAASKQQLWRGDATKTLDPSKNQEKNAKNLQKAINKLLKNFPPPSK